MIRLLFVMLGLCFCSGAFAYPTLTGKWLSECKKERGINSTYGYKIALVFGSKGTLKQINYTYKNTECKSTPEIDEEKGTYEIVYFNPSNDNAISVLTTFKAGGSTEHLKADFIFQGNDSFVFKPSGRTTIDADGTEWRDRWYPDLKIIYTRQKE